MIELLTGLFLFVKAILVTSLITLGLISFPRGNKTSVLTVLGVFAFSVAALLLGMLVTFGVNPLKDFGLDEWVTTYFVAGVLTTCVEMGHWANHTEDLQ